MEQYEQYLEYALYIGSVLGALALSLMMPREKRGIRFLGPLLGAAAIGGLWIYLSGTNFWGNRDPGISGPAFLYYYVFSGIAIVAAIRVITHTRPVYAALWFVMVVLASAGLFLVLSAQFMAFAVVIIYGGAILVTYMFVIMLATQPTPDGETGQPYDRIAKEPVLACTAGFLLLAVLLSVTFNYEWMNQQGRMPKADRQTDAALIETTLGNRPLKEVVTYEMTEDGESVLVDSATPPPNLDPTRLANAERIGLDLFQSHPLGLELAGVILLVSLIGAIVIAKTRVPDEHAAASD
jgi:NADH-quinone oxidoreductase subunit J